MILLAFGLASWLWASLPPPAGAGQLGITPGTIHIGAFFDGAQITLSDVIPRGCEAVVEVTGRIVEEDLMRKGRRWELWMNVGEIDIKGAPSFYMIATTSPGLLGGGASHPWGYHALNRRVSFKGPHLKKEEPLLFEEFIQLKEGQGVYGRFPGALQVDPADRDQAVVRGAFHFPVRISPGTYRFRLILIKNGQITEQRSIPLEVRMVGLPRVLTLLAAGHPVLYGSLCVVIAMAFGFLSGIFFRKIRLRSKPKGEC